MGRKWVNSVSFQQKVAAAPLDCCSERRRLCCCCNGSSVKKVNFRLFRLQGTGISEEVFRQIETVQNRYDSSTAAAFRAVQKSGEMVVRTLDPRQFIRLASETAPKINIDTNVSSTFLKKNLYYQQTFRRRRRHHWQSYSAAGKLIPSRPH